MAESIDRRPGMTDTPPSDAAPHDGRVRRDWCEEHNRGSLAAGALLVSRYLRLLCALAVLLPLGARAQEGATLVVTRADGARERIGATAATTCEQAVDAWRRGRWPILPSPEHGEAAVMSCQPGAPAGFNEPWCFRDAAGRICVQQLGDK